MSRFNVRPTFAPPAIPPSVPHDKRPSAYDAMKGRASNVVVMAEAPHVEDPKRGKGRPSKEEVRKRKLALASASIASLVSSKPTKAKIQEYMENRIMELDEEKR